MRPGSSMREQGDIPRDLQPEENGKQTTPIMKVIKGPRIVGMYTERYRVILSRRLSGLDRTGQNVRSVFRVVD